MYSINAIRKKSIYQHLLLPRLASTSEVQIRKQFFRYSSSSSSDNDLITKPPFRHEIKNEPKLRYALLIDGDNCQRSKLSLVLNTITSMGITMPIRRIYTDFSLPHQADWKFHCQRNTLDPIQVFSYAKVKNTVDIAVIMDAMDLLHQEASKLDGFVMVTSDSDYCRLAQRLQKAGKHVIGVGDSNTMKESFAESFDYFIFSDKLKAPSAPPPAVDVVDLTVVPTDDISAVEKSELGDGTKVLESSKVKNGTRDGSRVKSVTVNEMEENFEVTVKRRWTQSIWDLWSPEHQSDSQNKIVEAKEKSISTKANLIASGETNVQPVWSQWLPFFKSNHDSKELNSDEESKPTLKSKPRRTLIEESPAPLTGDKKSTHPQSTESRVVNIDTTLTVKNSDVNDSLNPKAKDQKPMLPDDMLDSLHSILYDLAKDEKTGWVNMIDFIRIWSKEQPDFQLKTYGYVSFKKLFKNHPDGFEIRIKPSRKKGISATDVRTLRYFPQNISS